MGATISTGVPSIFSRKTIEVLLVGRPSAGKSTICTKLKYNKFMEHIPTVGPLTVTVDYRNVIFHTTELAGGYKLIPYLWRLYIDDVDCLLYVIDASDRETIEEAHDELQDMVLTRIEKCKSKECIVLVLANKQDLPNCMSTTEIIDKIGLSALENCKWHIEEVSAVYEDDLNLRKGLDWLIEQL